MKHLHFYMITTMLLLTFITRGQPGNSTLNLEVSVHFEKISKAALLDSLSQRYQLYFSYSPELLKANEELHIETEEQALYQLLDQIIDKRIVAYKAFDNQIVLFPVESERNKSPEPDYIFLSGSIREQKNQDPLPYCNISIVGKSLGTMSNADGNFLIKIPLQYQTDTLAFSSLGYATHKLPIENAKNRELQICLNPKSYSLKTVDVIRYEPSDVLSKMDLHLQENYENDYTLLSTFYRELTQENGEYTDISEAVLQVMKAPYTHEIRQDLVKFIKGRKGAEEKALNNIRFRLMGGPYYITKLDVVKNRESFVDPELRHLYNFSFDKMTYIGDRPTIVLEFAPIYNLKDVLFEGKLFIDQETWALARVEFEYTRSGLKEARDALIHHEPKKMKAIPQQLSYVVQYKPIDEKWYLLSARSEFDIRIRDRDKRERTNFHSVSEALTTQIEKGDFQHFSRKEVFKSNEIFTDKIITYDKEFWENYNTIRPEEKLVDALKTFDKQNLVITYKN